MRPLRCSAGALSVAARELIGAAATPAIDDFSRVRRVSFGMFLENPLSTNIGSIFIGVLP
jgi:hypothetical protein